MNKWFTDSETDLMNWDKWLSIMMNDSLTQTDDENHNHAQTIISRQHWPGESDEWIPITTKWLIESMAQNQVQQHTNLHIKLS